MTSDHGFIYKRNLVQQSDKISTAEEPGKLKKRRYIVAKEPVVDDGVFNIGFLHLRHQGRSNDFLVRVADLLGIVLGFLDIYCVPPC